MGTHRNRIKLIAILFIVCVIFFLYLNIKQLRFIDTIIYALHFPTNAVVSTDIAIVEISDSTINTFGKWPWDRSILARTLEQLAQHKPKVIGIDIIFDSERSKTGDRYLASISKRYRNIVFAVTPGKSDILLYKKLLDTEPSIGSVNIDYSKYTGIGIWFFEKKTEAKTIPPFYYAVLDNYYRNNIKNKKKDTYLNFIGNSNFYNKYNEQIFPINFVGNINAFRRIPLETLLNGSGSTNILLKDKIVLIAVTTLENNDYHFTPLSVWRGERTQGTVITANAINTVLTRSQIRFIRPYLLFLLLISVLSVFFIISRSRLRRSNKLIMIPTLIILWGLLIHILFKYTYFYIPLMPFIYIVIIYYLFFSLDGTSRLKNKYLGPD